MSASINIIELLGVCVRAAMAAQQYIALDLLKLRSTSLPSGTQILKLDTVARHTLLDALKHSVDVSVKSELGYKQTDEAAKDLVTTADVLTQAVLEEALKQAFPHSPFTIIGEEDAPDSALRPAVEHCFFDYYSRDESAVPCWQELKSFAAAATTITAASVEELRGRVGIFIDPIDGTNCFVTGVWEAPMTLVGITLDSTPVAAVANRIFMYPTDPSANASARAQSVSYVWCPPSGTPFMVYEGCRMSLVDPTSTSSVQDKCHGESLLTVVQSSTTREECLAQIDQRLQPSSVLMMRGAGNKLLCLLQRGLSRDVAGGSIAIPFVANPQSADVFVCPENTIMKWDCCAPQAFLRAIGGDVLDHDGNVLLYPLAGSRAELTQLPHGVVGVAGGGVAREVAHRLGWSRLYSC